MGASTRNQLPADGSGTNQNSMNDDLALKIQSFSQGDTSALDSADLIEAIAYYLFKLYQNGDMGQALLLLERFGQGALNDDLAHRERSLIVLSLVAQRILEDNNEDLLEAIAQMLVRWLKSETEFIAGFEFVCTQLSRLIQKMLEIGLWYQAEDLLTALESIRRGSIPKDRLFRQVVTRSQNNIAEKPLLDSLSNAYTIGNLDKSDIAGKLLLQFGDNSLRHLLSTLKHCENKSQRYRLLELIPHAGSTVTPLIFEELKTSSPWYFTRNLIHMLVRISDPSQHIALSPFLKHTDSRVQLEAIDYFSSLNNEDGARQLLVALYTCGDQLKPTIIEKLGPLQDKRINNGFVGLLQNISHFEGEIQEDIVKALSKQLPVYPTGEALAALDKLLDDEQSLKNYATETISQLKENRTSLVEALDSKAVQKSDASVSVASEKEDAAKEDGSSNTSSDESGDNWYQEFCDKTENPAPLKKHMQQRKDFYSRLSQEEFLVFSSLLTHRAYDDGAAITAIGDVHSNLFFIDEGQVIVEFPDDGSSIDIRPLEKGDIFGHDIFMDGSEWEVALTAKGWVEVHMFDQEQLLRLQTIYPDLCRRIIEYCRKNDLIIQLFESARRKAPQQDSPPTIPFTDDLDDHIAEAEIIHIDNLGLCFRLDIPQGIDYTLFAGKELKIHLDNGASEAPSAIADVIGLRLTPQDNSLSIMAKISEKGSFQGHNVSAISL
ncbi:MAG: hypothetical protein QNJ17_01105 [Desulfocapsaceae bacterium]|nr:hypothetical protein [Desulfocapsaceae bacterium]